MKRAGFVVEAVKEVLRISPNTIEDRQKILVESTQNL